MEDLPDLRTDRLLLRPFRYGDVDDVFAYATDPEWNRYLGLPEPYTRSMAEEFVARALLAEPEKNPMWAIVHEGRVCGGIDLRIRRSGLAEMGYSIAQRLWGQGLMTEAVRAVVTHAFESMGIVRIQAYADSRNKGSWRVMEKAGMKREGVLRSNGAIRGESIDDVLYAIVGGAWPPPEPGE